MEMNDSRYIAAVLSEEAILERLVEKCGGLVWAAGERLRLLRGEDARLSDADSLAANYEDLVAAVGDVLSCVMAAEERLETGNDVNLSVERGTERWRGRVERRIRTILDSLGQSRTILDSFGQVRTSPDGVI